MAAFDDALRGLGVAPPPNHFDDLIQAAYTGPVSGDRISFRYRDALSQRVDVRLGENKYVGVDGVEYQHLGNDGWKYGVECFFTGGTHPTDARRFAALLLEPTSVGTPGLLEHPRDKVREVVIPFVQVVDDPNKDANQTMVRTAFYDQLTLPADKRDRPELAVTRALAGFNTAAADEFAVVSALNTVKDKVAAAREVVAQVNIITETMGEILDASSQIQADFNAIRADITNNLDTLLNAPAVLAANMTRLVQTALNAVVSVFTRADAFNQLVARSLGVDDDAVPTLSGSSGDDTTRNRANIQALVATSAVAGALTNVVTGAGQFLTKQAAYEAASSAMLLVGQVTRALEVAQGAFDGSRVQSKYVTPQTLANLNQLKRLCYAATQQLTNRLLATQIITLSGDRHMLDVCWEYYGDISDDTLNALIDTNNLSLEEMVVIPAGRVLFV